MGSLTGPLGEVDCFARLLDLGASTFFADLAVGFLATAAFLAGFFAGEVLVVLALAALVFDKLFFFALTFGFLVLLKFVPTPKGPGSETPNSEPTDGIRQTHP